MPMIVMADGPVNASGNGGPYLATIQTSTIALPERVLAPWNWRTRLAALREDTAVTMFLPKVLRSLEGLRLEMVTMV